MEYYYRGAFSRGLDSIVSMGVTFNGREPSEVRDEAAARWFDGHPDYVRVPDEPDNTRREQREAMRAALAAKRHPLDHDGNGKKGGSLKGRKKKKKA